MEGELAILCAVPKDASFRKLYHLFAHNLLTLSGVGAVQREGNFLATNDAHRHTRLLTIGRKLFGSSGGHDIFQSCHDAIHHLLCDATLFDDSLGTFGGKALKVVRTRCDEHTRHIKRARAYQHLLVFVFCKVAVGAVLFARDHYHDKLVALFPGHHVHHRLGLVGTQWHSLIQLTESLHAGLGALAGYCHHGAQEAAHLSNNSVAIIGHHVQVSAQALPSCLQGQKATGACLQVHMVGSRSATLRSVIEHHNFRIVGQQFINLAYVLFDALWHMLILRNGEVCGQDGERVDEQCEALFQGNLYLLFRTVLGTKEASTLLQCLLVYFGSRRYHTGWVEL